MTLSQIWRLLKWGAIYIGPQRDITVETFNGLLSFNSKEWLIGKYLYVRRSHEQHEISTVMRLLREAGSLPHATTSKTLLNVGANLGMSSIALVKEKCVEHAIAIEPAPDNYRLLAKNIRQNGLEGRIQHFSYALSSRDGEIELELSHNNSGDHRIRTTSAPGFFREERRKTITVPVRTLDSFLDSENVEPRDIGLAWVDIQGHEGHFFLGSTKFFRRSVPVVSEVWPYGISRSGISQERFCKILAEIFSSFYELDNAPYIRRPIGELESLFERYSTPRQFCTILMMP